MIVASLEKPLLFISDYLFLVLPELFHGFLVTPPNIVNPLFLQGFSYP